MSRSIHTTRRHLEERRKVKDDDKELRRAELRHLKEELRKKRLIKALVQEERRSTHPEAPLPPEAVPILIKDEHQEHLHYPASPEDILGLLRLMPAGYLNGLSSITLCLGEDAQLKEDGDELDPLRGRRGQTIFPGVYSANTIGMFYNDPARIELFAYVYQDDIKLRGLKETLLRMVMLTTLAHELAHHYDFHQRVARGRWRSENGERAEGYAEARASQWAQEHVAPYLSARYPDQTKALLLWLEEHAGVTLSLSALLRELEGGELFATLELLMEDIEEGKPRAATRVSFARNLHYGACYELAREALARVILEDPRELEALTLVADIDVHEERYEHAEALCAEVLALDPERREALEVLSDVYAAQSRWAELLEAATRTLALSPDGYWRFRARCLQGRALLMLSRDEALEEILEELPSLNERLGPSAVLGLRGLRLLQRGALEEALGLAKSALPACLMPARTMLEAVRLDAAVRLGRPLEAEALSAFALKHLRTLGFSAWSETLAGYQEITSPCAQ